MGVVSLPSLRSFRSSFTLSITLHFLLGLLCFFLLSHEVKAPARQLTWIEVEPLAPPSKKTQENLKNKNQVVQTEKTLPTQTAPKDSFLGEQNQTVDRETVSSARNTVIGKTQSLSKATGQDKKQAPAQKAVAKEEVPAVPQIGSLGVPILPKKVEPRSDEQIARAENWADQGGAPQDYVKGMKESDRTLLNTKEFVFYGYYQRIRERLDRAWVPVLRERLVKYYNAGRHLASDMDHSTKVLVILNPQGEITAVKVVSASGTRDLDDAAVDAFNEAGPFPNPPHGIVGSNGVIEIPWEFILRT
jgi:TonB family protein